MLSGGQSVAAVAEGRQTVVDIVESQLARFAQRDHAVRAWAHLDPDLALRQAGTARGPLAGLTVGVKDVLATVDMPTQCNSPIFEGQWTNEDAACVSALRAAGAVILGKTVTTEFAFQAPGPTRNPYDPARTPGGSSQGSAAAVADGQVHVALTTQTGGSTVRPASYCGVYGYKPPFGTIGVEGLRLLAPALDTIGLHGATLDDVATVASLLENRARRTEPSAAAKFVRLVPPNMDQVDAAMLDLVDTTMGRLATAGATMRDLVLPEIFHAADDCHRLIMSVGMARSFRDLWRTDRERLSPSISTYIELGMTADDQALAEAWQIRARALATLQALTEPGEILVTPAALGEATIGLDSTGNAAMHRLWTLLHVGTISLPVGTGPSGLPLGVQLIDPTGWGDHLFPAAAFAVKALDLPARSVVAGA